MMKSPPVAQAALLSFLGRTTNKLIQPCKIRVAPICIQLVFFQHVSPYPMLVLASRHVSPFAQGRDVLLWNRVLHAVPHPHRCPTPVKQKTKEYCSVLESNQCLAM